MNHLQTVDSPVPFRDVVVWIELNPSRVLIGDLDK